MKRIYLILALVVVAALLAGCGSIAQIEQARAARASSLASAEWSRARAVEVSENGLTERAEIRAAARAEARRDFYAVLAALTVGADGGGAAGTDHDGGITAAVGVGVGWPVLAIAAACLWGLVIWLYRRDRSRGAS